MSERDCEHSYPGRCTDCRLADLAAKLEAAQADIVVLEEGMDNCGKRLEAAEAQLAAARGALTALADDKALAAKTADGCRWQIQVSDDVREFSRAALSPPPATPAEACKTCGGSRVKPGVYPMDWSIVPPPCPACAAPPVPVEAGEGCTCSLTKWSHRPCAVHPVPAPPPEQKR